MDDLVSILKNGFTPRFCLENYSALFHDSDKEFMIAFPMTCFCDLPLSQLHKHLDFYGGYGIGLKKEWGIDRKINPVLYMHQKSDFSDYISYLINLYKAEQKEYKPALQYLMSILRHIKLYEGYVGRVYKRFYDEREWRWVPFLDDNNNEEVLSLTQDEYNDPQKLNEAEYDVSQRVRLDFEPDDIKYLVVASESEIADIIDKIGTMKDRYSEKELKMLYTKILYSEQIKTDF